MSYTVQPLAGKASLCGNHYHKQCKYVINRFQSELNCDPEITALMKKFNKHVLPSSYIRFLEKIWNLKVYEDDIWVITYPKCGTTWTQEAVWQICNDVDVDGKGKEPISIRFPFLELQSAAANPGTDDTIEIIKNLPRPRFIKSHLPIAFLPHELWTVKPKIIYVNRDAKDAAVSFYHHYYNLFQYQGTKEDFFEIFLKGEVENGSYWDHFEQFYLLQKYYPHIKIVKYEELKHNLDAVLAGLCKFLNKPLSDEQLAVLKDHLSFDKMKHNKSIYPYLKDIVKNYRPQSKYTFLRRGQTGSHKDEMSPEFFQKFDKITQERLHKLKPQSML